MIADVNGNDQEKFHGQDRPMLAVQSIRQCTTVKAIFLRKSFQHGLEKFTDAFCLLRHVDTGLFCMLWTSACAFGASTNGCLRRWLFPFSCDNSILRYFFWFVSGNFCRLGIFLKVLSQRLDHQCTASLVAAPPPPSLRHWLTDSNFPRVCLKWAEGDIK